MLTRLFLQTVIIVLLPLTTLALPEEAVSNEKIAAARIYQDVMAILDKEEIFLSYDDLLKIYTTITTSKDRIPGLEKILRRLMEKRNEHPRVDQMILIFTAKLIGGSKQEIPHVSIMFEDLTRDKRANLWAASFVAKALGDYFIDLQNGDYLAGLLDSRIDSLIAKENSSPDEYYGFHFLPPPADIYIKNIISRPAEQKRREYTRRYYYMLRSRNSEEQIRNYLLFLDKHGHLTTGKEIDFRMKYLYDNFEEVQAAAAEKQDSELPSK